MFVSIFSVLLLFGTALSLPSVQHARIVGRDTALRSSYDFVVIGGGTSGLTVADRLTENPESLSDFEALRKGNPTDALE
jgi:hypothetical protein